MWRTNPVRAFNRNSLSLLLVGALALFGSANANPVPDMDSAFEQIDLLISEENFTGAREQLSEIIAREVRDERIEIYHSRLRLFDSIEPPLPGTLTLSAQDAVTATDLFDSLKIALENGRIEQITQLSEPSTATTTLIQALLKNYSNIETTLTATKVDSESNSFFATLEFVEFKTKNGDTAFPSATWKEQTLRVTKTNSQWQKVHWLSLIHI